MYVCKIISDGLIFLHYWSSLSKTGMFYYIHVFKNGKAILNVSRPKRLQIFKNVLLFFKILCFLHCCLFLFCKLLQFLIYVTDSRNFNMEFKL